MKVYPKSCIAPVVGFTLDPKGEIALCCNSRRVGTKLSDISSIKDFFLDEKYKNYREINNDKGWDNITECYGCIRDKKLNRESNVHWFETQLDKPYEYYRDNLKFRFLEVTTSNICNLSCAMCNSYFSSMWHKIHEQVLGTPLDPNALNKISDHDLEKVLKVIPDLEVLMIKGGEPFADKANTKILKSLIGVNKNCKITIVSNMHTMSKENLDIMKALHKQGNQISLSVSIDGVGETYDWIRGGAFQTTVKTMERYYKETQAKFAIQVTVSVWNILRLKEIYQYFKDKPYLTKINFENIIESPYYGSPKLLSQDILDEYILDFYTEVKHTERQAEKKFIEDKYFHPEKGLRYYPYKTIIKNLLNLNSYELEMNDWDKEKKRNYYHSFTDYTNNLNKVRGSNIFDIQPDLKDAMAM